MRKKFNAQAASCVVLTLSLFTLLPAQQKPPVQVPTSARTVAGSRENVIRDQEREKLAQELAQSVFQDTRSILNPVIRAKIRAVCAAAYWHFQPQIARQIVKEELSALESLDKLEQPAKFLTESDGKSKYKGVPLAQVKADLRRELLATAAVNDASFLRELLTSSESDSAQQPDQQLGTAGDLAETDPQTSARLIESSLQNGIDGAFSFALMRLRETSPGAASRLFNQAFGQAKTSGDLWQFQRLVPFILPSETDRLVGGRHYLTDSQRLLDAKIMIEYGGEILYRRIQSVAPANMPQDQVRKEYFLWRNLQPLFEDINPNNLWLVNTRLRQLSATLPPTVQRPVDGPWSEERLKILLAAANQSTGDKRDSYLSAAASATWRLGDGDLDQAIALIDKISDPNLREDMAGVFYFQAGSKYLRSEGPDYALELARKISLPGPRTRLFLAIIETLRSVKAADRSQALGHELSNWLRNGPKNSDMAWALLDYIESSISRAPEDKFAAFELLVHVLNTPSLETNNNLKNRIYWHAEMHDFRRSLMPLVKADFERTLGLIQLLNNREMRLLLEAAFSADYLKSKG